MKYFFSFQNYVFIYLFCWTKKVFGNMVDWGIICFYFVLYYNNDNEYSLETTGW